MGNRPSLISQSDLTRMHKAASAAGYTRSVVRVRPDGTVEHLAETGAPDKADATTKNMWDDVNER